VNDTSYNNPRVGVSGTEFHQQRINSFGAVSTVALDWLRGSGMNSPTAHMVPPLETPVPKHPRKEGGIHVVSTDFHIPEVACDLNDAMRGLGRTEG